jgi:hypothetical protein
MATSRYWEGDTIFKINKYGMDSISKYIFDRVYRIFRNKLLPSAEKNTLQIRRQKLFKSTLQLIKNPILYRYFRRSRIEFPYFPLENKNAKKTSCLSCKSCLKKA